MRHTDADGNKVQVSKTVISVFRAIPQGKLFYGWELKEKCVELHPELEHTYTDTFLRQLRKYFCGCYEIVSHSKSLYKKTSAQYLEDTSKNSKTETSEYEKYKTLKQQSFDFGA